MKNHSLLLCCLLTLGACDAPPANGDRGAREARAIVVEMAVAQGEHVARVIERIGTLRPRREARLSLPQEGQLLELPYHEGARVEEGALLARLDDTLLRAQLKKSRAQRHQAEEDLRRLERLRKSRVVTEDELTRAATLLEVARAEEEALQVLLRQTRLLAPFDGVIGQRLAEVGDTLSRFSHLLTLMDVSSLDTQLTLSERVLPELAIGDELSLTIDALGPERFRGTLARIHPQVDALSRQGTIEVLFNPPPAGAMPGQLCRVTLPLRGAVRLLVPHTALRRDSRGEFLFMVNGDNRVARRAVVSGLHFDERVEILDGLRAGERIVTRGFLGLSEGSTVAAASAAVTP
ncbi:MAG: efflux RND transporter periplasmic adaptor subunit [Gammaproteobacteria bacterium]|nr:efflux RND transporter periplasmic adaptor subunit [Gammaproteobacteria bacterium]